LTLGPLGHRCSVARDDFQATWRDTEVVSADPHYRTNYGKIHYLQYLVRDHPLVMRPGQTYRIAVNFEPDVAHTGM
jgi:O-phosphoseryl-tRNA(Cys) synthetase